MKISALGKEWDINEITHGQRRWLFRLEEAVVISGSKFKVEDATNGEIPTVEISEFGIGPKAQHDFIEEALLIAFGKKEREALDRELTDTDQDSLARIIANEYLTIKKKVNGG